MSSNQRIDRIITFICAIIVSLFLSACSDPAADANKRLSDARFLFDSVEGKSVDQRISTYRKVDDILVSISRDFPETTLAITIAGDQPAAGLSRSIIKEKIQSSENEQCYLLPNTHCLGRIFAITLTNYGGKKSADYDNLAALILGKLPSDLSYDQETRADPWRIARWAAALGNFDLSRKALEASASTLPQTAGYTPEMGSKLTSKRIFYVNLLNVCYDKPTSDCISSFHDLSRVADKNSRWLEELAKAVSYMLYANGKLSKLSEFLEGYFRINPYAYIAKELIASPDGIYDPRDNAAYKYPADANVKEVFVSFFADNAKRLISEKGVIQNEDFIGALWAGVEKGQPLSTVANNLLKGQNYYLGPFLCTFTRQWLGQKYVGEVRSWADRSLVGYKTLLDADGWWDPSSDKVIQDCSLDPEERFTSKIKDGNSDFRKSLTYTKTVDAVHFFYRNSSLDEMLIALNYQFQFLSGMRSFNRNELDAAYLYKGLATGHVSTEDLFFQSNLNPSLHRDMINQQMLGVFSRALFSGNLGVAEQTYNELPDIIRQKIVSRDAWITPGDALDSLYPSRSLIELASRTNDTELKLWSLYHVVRRGIVGGQIVE